MARLFFPFLVALLLLPQQQAMAAIYKCIDYDGSVHFTDRLESENCRPLSFRRPDSSIGSGGGHYDSATIKQRAKRYEKLISYYGMRYDIDPHLIRAVIRTESSFNPRAVSSKGAQGLMQLMPGTARELSVANPFDPEENIKGGTRYLRSLLDTFDQDLRLALAAYNAGPTIVKKQRTIPRIPETVQYVRRVLTFYRQYKNGTA